MALVDELTISARAGKGGDGVVRWLHLKGKEYSGAAGGNGGNGGDVFVRGVRDIALLGRYRGAKQFKAGDGADGENQHRHGKRGDDFVVDLPVGSVVHNQETGEIFELMEEDQKIMVLRGGRGGAGNAVFKSSVNTTPTECTPGVPGESAVLKIELRLIADAGFIGLPNAGKSSLLNTITGASAKVGAYAFTTLDPNLGVLYGHVLADIPGLIEGASEGKGLGSKFLRHIARTKLLLHCVSLESAHPVADYDVVRSELKSFPDADLAAKPELIVLTKSDTKTPAEVERVSAFFRKRGPVAVVSILDDAQVKAFADRLAAALSTGAL